MTEWSKVSGLNSEVTIAHREFESRSAWSRKGLPRRKQDYANERRHSCSVTEGGRMEGEEGGVAVDRRKVDERSEQRQQSIGVGKG